MRIRWLVLGSVLVGVWRAAGSGSPGRFDRGRADRVFFWQQADSFCQYLFAIFRAVVWPAFLVYKEFQGIVG